MESGGIPDMVRQEVTVTATVTVTNGYLISNIKHELQKSPRPSGPLRVPTITPREKAGLGYLDKLSVTVTVTVTSSDLATVAKFAGIWK
jgi:hypothetical protein